MAKVAAKAKGETILFGCNEDAEPPSLDAGASASTRHPSSRYSSSSLGRNVSDRIFNRRTLLVRRKTEYRDLSQLEGVNVGWAQDVHIRTESATGAMGILDRRKKAARRFLCCGREVEPSTEPEQGESKPQYRLEAKRIFAGGWFKRQLTALRIFLCFGSTHVMYNAASSEGHFPSLHDRFVNYLNWMFRTSFMVFILYSAINYYILVSIFTGLIVAGGRMDRHCVIVGGEHFGHAGTEFADAFALSWTTFSTVGYGSVHPALSEHTETWRKECNFVHFVCVVESLVGVLFASFVGAILFGKMMRIQSRAQVLFSDPIVVRYGCGVETCLDGGDDEEKGENEEKGDDEEAAYPNDNTISEERKQQARELPCPVLEFRIANRLHNEVGGEIMNASLNVIASLDADEVDPSIQYEPWSPSMVSKWIGSTGPVDQPSSVTSYATSSTTGTVEDIKSGTSTRPSTKRDKESLVSNVRKSVQNSIFYSEQAFFGRENDNQAIEEDPTMTLAPRRIFSKLLIDASFHPLFKRAWLARHVLNETSPLLTTRARRLIRKNNGCWPEQLNSAEGVRESLRFNQILVSIKGVSGVSGSDVYAHKIYDCVDMVVGYQFVSILYGGSDGSCGVDLELLNDVRVQKGGGGEVLAGI